MCTEAALVVFLASLTSGFPSLHNETFVFLRTNFNNWEFLMGDKWLQRLMESSENKYSEVRHVDKVHFQLTQLWHIEPSVYRHRPHFVTGKLGKKAYVRGFFRKPAKEGAIVNEVPSLRVYTACPILNEAYMLGNLGKNYEDQGYNPDHTHYCIFPSESLLNRKEVQYYLSPYHGRAEYDTLDVTTFCQGGKDYYSSTNFLSNHPEGCKLPRMRCLFNTHKKYHEKPYRDLARANVGEALQVLKGVYYYLHYTYVAPVGHSCLWANCDPVIYVTFSGDNGLMEEARFDGYYTLSQNEATKEYNTILAGEGLSSYRHLVYHKYILYRNMYTGTNRSDVGPAHDARQGDRVVWGTSDLSYPIVFPKQWSGMAFEVRTLNYTTGETFPVAYNLLWDEKAPKKEEPLFRNRMHDYMLKEWQPVNKFHVCLKEIMTTRFYFRQWYWSKYQPFGKQFREEAFQMRVQSGDTSRAPVRAPCGIAYRPSENYAISSGRLPWLVKIRIGESGSRSFCTGSVITPRHVLTAANCFCNTNWHYNPLGTKHPVTCSTKKAVSRETMRHHYYGRTMNKIGRIYTIDRHNVYGTQIHPFWTDILFVSLHESYTKAEREYDVAIVGTKWSLSFSETLLPACLPNTASSDSNNLPHGMLLYSVKSLVLGGDTHAHNYTNANGPSKYAKCRSPCYQSSQEKDGNLLEFLMAQRERTNASYDPFIFNTFPVECQAFWEEYLKGHDRIEDAYDPAKKSRNPARDAFYKGWIEPQSVIKLWSFPREGGYPSEYVKCYDIRETSYRVGWCKTKLVEKENNFHYYRSWGFCDDSTALRHVQTHKHHPFYEVETTLVPQVDCMLPQDTLDSGRPVENMAEMSLTKICTMYVPHKPSEYELNQYWNEDGSKNYSLIRYLGGYYRDFLPKIWRRKKRVHYDQFGEITFNERDPKYHSGFPQRLEVCHEDDIDVGAPTHVRLARLFNPDTDDTTQEPEGQGVSTYVIVAIQSGRSGTGKMCNKKDGSYADVETVMTSNIMDFIMSEISELDKFDEIHPKENYVMKIRSQRTTASSTTPTTTTTLDFGRENGVRPSDPFFPDKIITPFPYEYYEEEEIPDPFSGDYYETVDNRAASPGLTPRRNELLFTAVVVSALRVQTRVLP